MMKQTELIATRVSRDEKRLIGAAARLEGETITEFLRALAIPAAMSRLERATETLFAKAAG